jgi:hypothetical protein
MELIQGMDPYVRMLGALSTQGKTRESAFWIVELIK